jgi:DNA polymerase-3 subunit gamma/tau
VSAGPSLYRRHRPRTFADVVGQEHVVRTLRNAIEQGKVHHAYLFVGSRGTGKTSMAKILAACLNCENGPTTEPCGACASCLAIQNATSLDVIEMDAASHNSVDDIRELRESVAFAPVSGRSKVYILDEAHMLTPQAWNAFLKTLEEPPPNTIFVLATTEAQKVLPTVVDRCHRFDFTRPTVEQLSSVLRRVAGQEGIEIAPDALALLARHATGSFRDALGTLEQLVTYTGTQIAVADVLAVLGAVDDDLLFGALDAVAAHDAALALRAAAGLAATGRDLTSATRDLEVHARELLVVGTLGDVPAELRVTADRDARLLEQARRVPEGDVVRLLDLLGASLRAAKDGADPRTQLELALVKAAAPEVDASTKALLARIARLEAALDGGGAPAAPAPEPVPPSAPAPAAEPAPPPVTPAARAAEHAAAPPPPPPGPAQPSSAVPVAPAVIAVAEPEPEPAPPAVPDPPAPGRTITIEELREVWPAVLETIAEDFSLLAAALGNAHPAEITDGALIVAFAQDDSFNRRMAAESADHRRVLGEALQALTGVRLRLAYELRDLGEVPAGPPPLAGEELVARIVQEFDAEEIVPETVADPDPEGPA